RRSAAMPPVRSRPPPNHWLASQRHRCGCDGLAARTPVVSPAPVLRVRAAEAPVRRRGSFQAAGCRAPDPRIDAAPLRECAPQRPELDDRRRARHGLRPCASPKILTAIVSTKLPAYTYNLEIESR